MKKALYLSFLGLACGPQASEVNMLKGPRKIEPDRFALIKAEKTLDNGLTVIAVQKDKLPVFQISLQVVAGSALDPKGKEGLANLTADLLDEGAGGLSASDIAEAIEGMGAQMRISADRGSVSLGLKCLSPDADSGLAILSKVLTSPDFKRKDFSKAQKRIVSSIYSSKSDPNTVVSWVFGETVYGDHPLAHPGVGYDSAVRKLKLEDVKGFYKDWFYPANALCVVVSDLKPESAIALVEKHLGSWKAQGKALPEMAPPSPIKGRIVKVVRMPEVNQCYISLGSAGIKRTSPDYNALRTANYILGGSGFSSRITKRIRVQLGYAYSVYSYYSSGYAFGDEVIPGIYYAGLETKLATGNQAIAELLKLIANAKDKGFSREELEAAQKYYTGSIARSGETYGQIAGNVLYGKRFGLPDLYWIKDIVAISQLSLEDVNRAAARYLDPENFVLVVVADTSFRLEGFPEAQYIDWK